MTGIYAPSSIALGMLAGIEAKANEVRPGERG
jgi:hypothetical protein